MHKSLRRGKPVPLWCDDPASGTLTVLLLQVRCILLLLVGFSILPSPLLGPHIAVAALPHLIAVPPLLDAMTKGPCLLRSSTGGCDWSINTVQLASTKIPAVLGSGTPGVGVNRGEPRGHSMRSTPLRSKWASTKEMLRE